MYILFWKRTLLLVRQVTRIPWRVRVPFRKFDINIEVIVIISTAFLKKSAWNRDHHTAKPIITSKETSAQFLLESKNIPLPRIISREIITSRDARVQIKTRTDRKHKRFWTQICANVFQNKTRKFQFLFYRDGPHRVIIIRLPSNWSPLYTSTKCMAQHSEISVPYLCFLGTAREIFRV